MWLIGWLVESVLPKASSAKVTITLRAPSSGTGARGVSIPLEPFSVNKEMGRILLRRGGETIAAGEHSRFDLYSKRPSHASLQAS
jgi:hypothetical protein